VKIYKKTFKLSVVLSLISLLGCTVGPDYTPPCIEVPAKFKEARSGWKIASPKDNYDRGNWWTLFKDQKLNALLDEADCANQSLILAEAQYRQSLALVAEARAGYFPTLTANASASRQQNSSSGGSSTTTTSTTNSPSTSSTSSNGTGLALNRPFSTFLASLSATWEPDIWGAVRRTVEASEAFAESDAAQIASVRLSIQALIAQYYFELRYVDSDQILLDETLADYKKSLQITQNRYQQGVASRLDILQAETQLKNAEVLAIDNGINRALYEHAIAVLIGTPPSCFSIPVMPLNQRIPEIPCEVPSEMLERRPDVAQAERLIAQANAQIGIAIAAFYPTISLTGSYGYLSNHLNRLITPPTRFWSLGAALAETILDGGFRIAATESAMANYDQTVANYRQTVLTAFQNVEDNLATVRILKKEISKSKELVDVSEKELKFTMNQYKSGVLQYTDVILAQTAVFNAKKNYNDTNARVYVAAVNLIKALGGGWD
jgi:NodT family efflux transporter outer membrane factor (OMF) lipoprotein